MATRYDDVIAKIRANLEQAKQANAGLRAENDALKVQVQGLQAEVNDPNLPAALEDLAARAADLTATPTPTAP